MEEERKDQAQTQPELSAVWQELLGNRPAGVQAGNDPGAALPPALEGDPWSALLQAKGIEVIDLQQLHLPVSAQELERLLQVMQEQPAQNQGAEEDAASSQQ